MVLAFSWARARGPTLSTVWGGFFLYNIVHCARSRRGWPGTSGIGTRLWRK